MSMTTKMDIERAIKVLEEEYAFAFECDDTQKRSSALHTALTVIRAELARQDAKPLTCDGCMREEIYKELDGEDKILITCLKCERSKKTDRYEPKGEKE